MKLERTNIEVHDKMNVGLGKEQPLVSSKRNKQIAEQ